jgi:hypothetical protein
MRLPLTIDSGHSQKRASHQRFFFTGSRLESFLIAERQLNAAQMTLTPADRLQLRIPGPL